MTAGQVGILAEDEAERHLAKKSYGILRRNYRIPQGEIDIIAMDGNILVFAEVKYLGNPDSGYFPEERVTATKRARIVRAARSFLQQHPHDGPCRFDVLAVTPSTDLRSFDIRHVEDAFEE